jgi:hypothetical protein
MTIFYCLRFETPPTWRVRSQYLYPAGTGWPNYIPRYWVPFSSPPTTRRAMVEVWYASNIVKLMKSNGTSCANHEVWMREIKNMCKTLVVKCLVNSRINKMSACNSLLWGPWGFISIHNENWVTKRLRECNIVSWGKVSDLCCQFCLGID